MIQHHQRRRLDGEGALRAPRRRAGRDRLQVRLRRQRRSDHRDRAHGEDAAPRSVDRLHDLAPRFPRIPAPSHGTRHGIVSSRTNSGDPRRLAAPVASPRWRRCATRTSTGASMSHRSDDAGGRAPIRASASRPGMYDAGEARVEPEAASRTTPPSREVRRQHQLRPRVHRQLRIQGSYNGYQVWDISNPGAADAQDGVLLPGVAERRLGLQEPALRLGRGTHAAASTAATQGVKDTVSKERLRGLRIFDITDIAQPEERRQRADLPRLAHAHACSSIRRTRTTSTSTSPARPACARRASCRAASSAHAGQGSRTRRSSASKSSRCRSRIRSRRRSSARRASSTTSTAPPTHGEAPADIADAKRGRGAQAQGRVHRDRSSARSRCCRRRLRQAAARQRREGARRHRRADRRRQRGAARGAPGHHREDDRRRAPRTARSRARRSATTSPSIRRSASPAAPATATACCSTSSDPAHPTRLDAVADSNFSYWHSATFNNDGTKVLFSDEWGGGGQPKCRATDPKRVGRRRDLHDRRTASCSSRATTRCRRRRRRRRTASRTTAR